jgi:hypothetical protein
MSDLPSLESRFVSEGPGAVALELAPLIAPYRKHGRLSLRVERLPPRARLSHGHDNGDRSWSLRPDELDGHCDNDGSKAHLRIHSELTIATSAQLNSL